MTAMNTDARGLANMKQHDLSFSRFIADVEDNMDEEIASVTPTEMVIILRVPVKIALKSRNNHHHIDEFQYDLALSKPVYNVSAVAQCLSRFTLLLGGALLQHSSTNCCARRFCAFPTRRSWRLSPPFAASSTCARRSAMIACACRMFAAPLVLNLQHQLGRLPLMVHLCKALDSTIYRNTECDVYRASFRQHELHDHAKQPCAHPSPYGLKRGDWCVVNVMGLALPARVHHVSFIHSLAHVHMMHSNMQWALIDSRLTHSCRLIFDPELVAPTRTPVPTMPLAPCASVVRRQLFDDCSSDCSSSVSRDTCATLDDISAAMVNSTLDIDRTLLPSLGDSSDDHDDHC